MDTFWSLLPLVFCFDGCMEKQFRLICIITGLMRHKLAPSHREGRLFLTVWLHCDNICDHSVSNCTTQYKNSVSIMKSQSHTMKVFFKYSLWTHSGFLFVTTVCHILSQFVTSCYAVSKYCDTLCFYIKSFKSYLWIHSWFLILPQCVTPCHTVSKYCDTLCFYIVNNEKVFQIQSAVTLCSVRTRLSE